MRYISVAIADDKADKLGAKLKAKNEAANKAYEDACDKAEAEGHDRPNKPILQEMPEFCSKLLESAAG